MIVNYVKSNLTYDLFLPLSPEATGLMLKVMNYDLTDFPWQDCSIDLMTYQLIDVFHQMRGSLDFRLEYRLNKEENQIELAISMYDDNTEEYTYIQLTPNTLDTSTLNGGSIRFVTENGDIFRINFIDNMEYPCTLDLERLNDDFKEYVREMEKSILRCPNCRDVLTSQGIRVRHSVYYDVDGEGDCRSVYSDVEDIMCQSCGCEIQDEELLERLNYEK